MPRFVRKKQQVFDTDNAIRSTLPDLVQRKKRPLPKNYVKKERKRKTSSVSNAEGAKSSNKELIRSRTSRDDLVVTVRLARCKMPYRWREPLPPFVSILSETELFDQWSEAPDDTGAACISESVLHRSMNGDEVKDESWLSSSFIDLVLSRFAKTYRSMHFMPIEFSEFRLKTMQKSDMLQATDLVGKKIDYNIPKPVIFFANIANMHWNVLRVQHWPLKELQLFEPMGKPASRNGVSYRNIPQHIIHWLDTCWPLDEGHPKDSGGRSWIVQACSAITTQHQVNSFDCGVACLLYAEKCAQGMMKEDIHATTNQRDITEFRQCLQRCLRSLNSRSLNSRQVNSPRGNLSTCRWGGALSSTENA